jgi:hypothetical protein
MTSIRSFLAAAVLAMWLVSGAMYATLTPAWQAPDEPAHYNYVRYLATRRAFPELTAACYNQAYLSQLTTQKFPPTLAIDSVCYEFHQPPLYYLLAAPLFRFTGGALLAIRLMSVLLGAGTVWLTYLIGLTVFEAKPLLALGAMAFVAFVPMHAAMLASVNNDALAGLIFAAILLTLMRRQRRPADLSIQNHLTLGLLLGLALLTKTTIYIAVPLVAVALLLEGWAVALTPHPSPDGRGVSRQRRGEGKSFWNRLLSRAAAIFGPALLIVLPWFGRNAALYGHFDVLGLGRHDEVVVGQLRTATHVAQIGPGPYLAEAATTTFHSFWGQFGWMAVPMDDRTYRLLALLTLAALTGLAAWVIVGRRECPVSAAQGRMLGLLGVSLLGTVTAFGGYNLSFVQFQGRYLFTGLMPLALFFALGWHEAVRPHWGRGLVAGLLAGIGWLALAGGGPDKWGMLLPGLFLAAALARLGPARYRAGLTLALEVAGYAGLAFLTVIGPYWFIVPNL